MRKFIFLTVLFFLHGYSSIAMSNSSDNNKVEELSGDEFIQRVKDLTAVEFESIKDKDITLLVGPTGAGKSTILNMIAGSSFTCRKNDCDEWEISATSSVSDIGHVSSETFLPQPWIDPLGNIFYDCPGFEDTRGVDYDIAKSYFLRIIGDHARSMKVLLVEDIANLRTERGGHFKTIIKQMINFIPTFNFVTDSGLIITKAESSKTPLHIANILKILKYDYPEPRITISYLPDNLGKLPILNFGEILDRVPSIKTKCGFSLSDEAKLIIQKFKSEFESEIKVKIGEFSQSFNFYYIELLQGKLEATGDEIKTWYYNFKELEDLIQQTSDIEKLIPNLEKIVVEITSLGKSKRALVTEEFFPLLCRKLDNLKFFKSVSTDVEYSIKDWLSGFKFTYDLFYKSNNLSQLNNTKSFNEFLGKRKLNAELSIKDQVHKQLNVHHIFTATYSGNQNHSGKIKYAGEVPYSGSASYSGVITHSDVVPYSGRVNHSGSAAYSGEITTSKCTHDKGLINTLCWRCDHYDIVVPYTGTAQYRGVVPYSGEVSFNNSLPYAGVVEYNGVLPYSGEVSFDVNIPYVGDHEVKCQSHHLCSCNELSLMILCATELCKDIEYYQEIIKLQNPHLKKQQHSDKDRLEVSNFMSNFLLKGKILADTGSKIDRTDMKDRIHEILKGSSSFNAGYKGTATHLVQKPYLGQIPYTGSESYSCTIPFSINVPYSGIVDYSGNQNYSGSVAVKSCYDPCGWCKGAVTTSRRHYSGSIHYSGSQPYSGIVGYSKNIDRTGTVKYKGIVPYSGEVSQNFTVSYGGSHEVTCQEDHHTCDSCNAWDLFVSKLTILLKEKESCIRIIRSDT